MKGRAIWLAALLLLAALPIPSTISPAYAAFGTPKNISNNATDSSLSFHKGSQIAFSGSNVYVVWEELSDDEIYFARSTNGGTTFSAPANISNDLGVSAEPQIAASGSSVYIVWETQLSINGGEIMFARSTNSGSSFDTPVKLSGSSTESDNARMATAGVLLYVTWDDPDTGDHEVIVAASNDNGASFHTTANVSNDGLESTQPSIAAVGDNVYVGWRSVNGTDTFVLFDRSVDRGSTYGTAMTLGTNNGTNEGPEVAAAGPEVHVAWLDDDLGNIDTYHRFSDDSGSSFDPETNLSNNTGD